MLRRLAVCAVLDDGTTASVQAVDSNGKRARTLGYEVTRNAEGGSDVSVVGWLDASTLLLARNDFSLVAPSNDCTHLVVLPIGSAPRELPAPSACVEGPSISPDRRRIAFGADDRIGVEN